MIQPFVTVAVPLLNEATVFPGLLAALHGQTYPGERTQVFLVDGGSDDGTRSLAAAAVSPYVHLLDNPDRSAPAALNLALAAAAGEYFLRLDARTRPAPDYIERCVNRLAEGAWAGVAGPQVAVGETPASRAHALVLNHPLGVGAPAYRRARRPVESETLYLGAYKTAWLRRIGGWDERLAATEDFDLNERVRRSGGRLLVDPDIHCRYLVRENLGDLARQYARYGAWRTIIWRRHPRSLRPRHAAPALLVLSLALGLAALFWTPIPLATILALYLGGILVASLQLALAHGRALFPRLLATFLALHLAWGLAFWWAWLQPPRFPSPEAAPL